MRFITLPSTSTPRLSGQLGDHVVPVIEANYGDWPLGSAPAGAQVVGASGFESRPLGDGPSTRPHCFPSRRAAASPRVGALLRPAGRRVLPLLLPPVDGQVE